jgi:hypothetical protein
MIYDGIKYQYICLLLMDLITLTNPRMSVWVVVIAITITSKTTVCTLVDRRFDLIDFVNVAVADVAATEEGHYY